MAGVLIAVVGPSGAGKDTLLSAARSALAGTPRVLFVRRTVTRVEDSSEDHDSLSPDAFRQAEKAGAFSLIWAAHGLHYGLPASLMGEIAGGRVCIANLSRAALPRAAAVFGHVVPLVVTARPEVLEARLAGRRRASDGDLTARLTRDVSLPEGVQTITIDNSGALADSLAALLGALRPFLDQ